MSVSSLADPSIRCSLGIADRSETDVLKFRITELEKQHKEEIANLKYKIETLTILVNELKKYLPAGSLN
jgi:hypothetical protein